MAAARKKSVARPCPICAGGTGEVLHTQAFAIPDGYPLPGSYDVVSCAACGFVYADTPATQEAYDRYYGQCSKYEDLEISSGGGGTPWDRERSGRTAEAIAALIPDRGAALIDVGCANGGILAALKALGYARLTGLDPSQACVDHIRERGGIERAMKAGICSPAVKDDASLRGRFDCAIMSHVAEHLYDLRAAIDGVAGLLKPGGYAYIDVPDASRYARYPAVPYYYFDCEHINHFDEHALGNLLAAGGLDTVSFVKQEIKASASMAYPSLVVTGRKPSGRAAVKAPVPSFAVRDSMRGYIEGSKKAEEGMDAQLRRLAGSQEPLIVWGAGSFAQRLLADSPLGACHIAAFIDNDPKKWGSRIRGIDVHPPDHLMKLQGTLVIASALFSGDIRAQAQRIDKDKEAIVLR